MNRLLIAAFFLFSLGLSSCNLFRQATLASDPRTDSLILEGKQALRKGENMDAWDAFEMAREREFNRSTTAAIYLAGLAASNLRYDDIAEQRFNTIIRDFPRSKYVDDAKYHLGLIKLRSNRNLQRELEGMDDLMNLSRNAKDPRLGNLALDAWRDHLFHVADRDVLETYVRSAPASMQAYVMEALIYQILMQDGPVLAQHRLSSYREDGGQVSSWLSDLFPEEAGGGIAPVKDPRWEQPNLLRIGLVLPFQMNQIRTPEFLDQIPANQVRPLELYEGFQMAVNQYQANGSKRVFLKVIDSRRDTFQTRAVFRSLDSLGVQLLVGDVYNAQSRVLSEWAESRGVPQLIPLSPSEELVQDKRNTFLANPTASTHGRKMAEYAYNQLGLRQMYVFTDGGEGTRELMTGFREQFTSAGGIVDTLAFSSFFEDVAIDQIPDLVRSIPAKNPNAGIYLPIMGNEEAASLILNILQAQGSELPVMGSPHFRSNYNTISPDTKSAFNLIFSTSYLTDSNDPAFEAFTRQYLQEYGFPPSEYVIQGYDLGRYVLHQLNAYQPSLGMDLATFMRASPAFRALHIPYQFSSRQSNQGVNLGQFTDLGIIRLN